MGRKVKDISGQRYGRVVVGEFSHIGSYKKAYWKVLCDCGRTAVVAGHELTCGHTSSCGCLQKEMAAERGRTSHGTPVKHGHARKAGASREYSSWRAMTNRCERVEDKSFDYYGGRGITVCERWRTFDNFLADMGIRPAGTSLDRIETNGNYEPDNCRWATPTQQIHNRRTQKEGK